MFRLFSVLLVCLFIINSFTVLSQNPLIIPPDTEPANSAFRFIENRGQIKDIKGQLRPDIIFHSDRGQFESYFAKNTAHFVFSKFDEDPKTIDTLVRVDMIFEGGNLNPEVSGIDVVHDFTNYFLGHTGLGLGHVPAFERIQYTNVWPNVDAQFYTNSLGLKTYFILHPSTSNEFSNGNPDDIALKFEGTDNVQLSVDKKMLTVHTPLGTFVQHAPHAFRIVNSNVVHVPVQFVMKAPNTIGFKIPNSSNSPHPTVIQMDAGHLPPFSHTEEGLTWSTYFGSAGSEDAVDLVIDNDFSVYIIGTTNSSDLPDNPGITEFQETSAGLGDAYIAKFNNNSELEWSTFYGGSFGDHGLGITWTSNDHLFIIGRTKSDNLLNLNNIGASTYIQTNPAFDGIFLARLSPVDGIPDWSSFFGGEASLATDITSDDFNNIYIAGYANKTSGIGNNNTSSPCNAPSNGGFPICDPGAGSYVQSFHAGGGVDFFADGFISKFTSSGELLWSTLFGGAGDDIFYGIEIDKTNDRIYVAGKTTSQTITDNPCGIANNSGLPLCHPGNAFYDETYNGGLSDILLAKFSPSGNLIWSSYIGGPGEESASSLATNFNGDVFITGFTTTLSYDIFSPPCGLNSGANGFPLCTPPQCIHPIRWWWIE